MNLQKNLAQLKKQRSMTTEALAACSGVPRGTINKLLCGETRNPTAQTLHRLAQALNCPLDALCDPPAAEVPPATEPTQTTANPIQSNSEPTQSISEPTQSAVSLDPAAFSYDFALRAVGDSMIGARIRDGDLVFIRRQSDVPDGRIAAVALNGTLALKRVYHIPNGLQLLSENPASPPILYTFPDPPEPIILGLAVGFQSKL